ncbi:MAG: hypothetical protein Q8P45_03085 [Candidatus Harrisonbacteria bacterium]|nr:hypothetical protein [Candidatus Harrisonbacteria bacterium]
MKKSATTLFKIMRIALGWIFLWAFLDKLIGLGFSSCRTAEGAIESFCQSAWLSGGSPTAGFLSFATKGPFAGFFQSLAGSAALDWIFMLGLLFIGLSLILNIKTKLGAYAGVLLLLLMYSAALPPEHNPVIDEHIIYALVLLYIGAKSKRFSASQPF